MVYGPRAFSGNFPSLPVATRALFDRTEAYGKYYKKYFYVSAAIPRTETLVYGL
jgi:hypothetical protein